MSNNADKNEVIEFQREPNGSYRQNNFATFGRGTGGVNDPLESQGSLTLSADHKLLFAANAGSGDITVFRIVHNGLAFTEKVPSGGSQPVSIAQRGNVLYVLNSGGAGSVVAFNLDQNGRLHRIKHSTAFLSANATGGASISISPDGRFVAVVERIANKIDTFRIKPDGTLATAVVTSSPGPGAFSAQFAPNGKLIVSETGPSNIPDGSAISSYIVQQNGSLVAVSQSVATDGAANCWNVISPDGARVYASNAGTSNLAGFSIGAGGELNPLKGTIVGSNPDGSTNLDIAISQDGKFLYSLNGIVGSIGVFQIQPDGTLNAVEQIEGLPHAVGFNGIAAL
ncbi:MAG: beta-propeller fold lactonase family protein [Acidobacteria bacterium]|nr:beta-propeller fold lactonase family protein [Acidobacteriota bacterium]